MSILEFPTDVSGMLDALRGMYRDGCIREFIVYAPSAVDAGAFHFRASDGIKLIDVLLAKNELSALGYDLTRSARNESEAEK